MGLGHIGRRRDRMDVILYTTKIRIGYPNDREQPKGFRVQVGRSTNSYHYNIVLGATTNTGKIPLEFGMEFAVDGSVTGTYYVKISAVHYDDSETAGGEFTVNVVEPTDVVVAPIVSVC